MFDVTVYSQCKARAENYVADGRDYERDNDIFIMFRGKWFPQTLQRGPLNLFVISLASGGYIRYFIVVTCNFFLPLSSQQQEESSAWQSR